MVEVGVGDQDRLDGLDPEAVEGGEELVGLVTGVDDQRIRGVLAAHDEAVLLHRADREHPDVDHFPAACFLFASRRRYMNNSM